MRFTEQLPPIYTGRKKSEEGGGEYEEEISPLP